MHAPNLLLHYAKNYTPADFLVTNAELHLELDENTTIVKSSLHIERNPQSTKPEPALILDGNNLTLLKVQLDGKELTTKDYTLTPTSLGINIVPEKFVLQTRVQISPLENKSLAGLYLSNGNFCTQCEPDGFRRITYFPDRPDILTKFTITIVADKTKYPVLLANGNLIEHGNLANNKHWATWNDPTAKSAYLCAIIAGDFAMLEDHYVTNSGRDIVLKIYADKKSLSECHYALQSLQEAMRWDEENFSREYDLDIYMLVAIDDFNAAAMENKGLNVFNSDYILASPSTSTDADFAKIASVIAHEYFHNWTGNRITIRDWFQLGLKEGLTTFREQLFAEQRFSHINQRIDTIRFLRTKQFAEDAGPLAHPVRLQSYLEVNNFYTVTVYYKSAEIARMLYTLVGTKVFRQIMEQFFQEFDASAVTIEDFLSCAEKVANINLDQFKLWYDKPKTPTVKINSNYDANTKQLNINCEQTSPIHWHIPLAIGLLAKNGTEISLQQNPLQPESTYTKILQLRNQQDNFTFTNVPEKPTLSILRNFSAPINVVYAQSEADLIFLMQHDTDFFNRWSATQELLTNIMLKLCVDAEQQQKLILSPTLIDSFKTIIRDTLLEPAFKAQLLQLPSENYILDRMSIANIETVNQVSLFIKNTLAATLHADFLACYQENHELQPFSLDAEAIGKRALKNLCLLYLMAKNDNLINQLCLNQYHNADNMSDVYGCLTAVINTIPLQHESLLNDFYQKWQHEQRVVNKWLTLNASIKAPGTLQRVKNLMQHQAFKITNPNNVYALLRTFCENNHTNFHQQDGSGYKFIAEQICSIDAFNHQLAATLLRPLTKWQRYSEPRSTLMRQELEWLLQQPRISPNVFELVSQALEAM